MVAKSPHRFAIMQSGTERFKEARSRDATPFGVYNVDAAHRKDLTSSVRGECHTDALTFLCTACIAYHNHSNTKAAASDVRLLA